MFIAAMVAIPFCAGGLVGLLVAAFTNDEADAW